MPLFGPSSPFDQDVGKHLVPPQNALDQSFDRKSFVSSAEKITNEKNTSEDWGLIMDLCDRVSASRDGPRDCLKAIVARLNHRDPHVSIQAITVRIPLE